MKIKDAKKPCKARAGGGGGARSRHGGSGDRGASLWIRHGRDRARSSAALSVRVRGWCRSVCALEGLRLEGKVISSGLGGWMLFLMKMALNQCTKHLRRQLRVLESCFLWANQLLFFFFPGEYSLIFGYKSFIKVC